MKHRFNSFAITSYLQPLLLVAIAIYVAAIATRLFVLLKLAEPSGPRLPAY
jgi:hypothetical protein